MPTGIVVSASAVAGLPHCSAAFFASSAVRWMVHMRVHAIPTLSNHQDPLAVLACCLEAVKDAVFNSARDLALTGIAVDGHRQLAEDRLGLTNVKLNPARRAVMENQGRALSAQ